MMPAHVAFALSIASLVYYTSHLVDGPRSTWAMAFIGYCLSLAAAGVLIAGVRSLRP